MSYRNKTYVAFDADTDMHYYDLMLAWKAHPNIPFNFYNAHALNQIREWSQEESKKRQLRERMLNSKFFILLVGEHTKYLRKYVKWEIELALEMDLPIVCANLNGLRVLDRSLCPAILRDELVLHINYGLNPIKKSMEVWSPARIQEFKRKNEIGPCVLSDELYNSINT
jgi:hypothetical protein